MKEETQNQDEVKKIVVDENLAKQVEQKVNATTVSNNDKQEARVNNMLKSMANANVGEILKKIQPVIDIFNKVASTIFPIISIVYARGVQIYRVLPLLIIKALIGLAMTFFGGTYAVSIAAIEAFTQTGYEKFMVNATYLYTEFEILWKKSREDDKVDEDGDGIYDVLQITTYQLFQRKVAFFFANCSDPQKMMDMVAGILTGLASIVAVLKLQFAKVIALGATIGEILRKTASIPLVPLFSQLLPQKYHQWICPGINLVCKIIAISIAWYVQRVISSVQSAIRGGLMFSRNILQHLNDKGYIKFKEEESYLDEIIGWGVAALGVYFQVRHGFSLPFPLNLLFFPLSIFEDVLVWIVSNY